MAEEKADDILEEETAKESKKKGKDDAEATEGEESKKGLSTSLLIKVAIGLGVLLIALIAAFFLLSGSPEPESADTNETAISQTESEETTESASEDPSVVTPESGTIDLPPVAETTPDAETAPEAVMETNAALDPAALSSTVATPNPSTQRVLAEMMALQEQLNSMREENQKLIRRVEELTKESQTLSTQLPQKSNTSMVDPINDEQVVNRDDVPLYYRENRYANTPQPELAPQWGEPQQDN